MNSKKQLKQKLKEATGTKNTLLFSSCRNALFTLCKSLNFKKEDEVIVQDFICDSLPWAIEKAGAKVIRAQVNKDTLNLDIESIKSHITKNTKAILFVHTYGNPSGISEVTRFCKEQNILLIEDIAHALTATENKQFVGSFGGYAVFSLTKQLVGFGGGAILSNHSLEKAKELQGENTNSADLLEYPKRLVASMYETRAFKPSKILIDIARKNADLKMTNALSPQSFCSKIEAFVAKKQIAKLPSRIKRRKRNYLYLSKKLTTNALQVIKKNAESSFNYIALKFPDEKTRDAALKNHKLFLPPWPNSSVSNTLIFIPNNPYWNNKDLETIATAYNKAFKMNE